MAGRASWLGVLQALALAVGGCEDTERPGPQAAPAPASTAPGVKPRPKAATIALHGASSPLLTPFPSDRYLAADPTSPTGKRVKLSGEAPGDPMLAEYPALVEQLSGTDGFSTVGGVVVHFSGEIDGGVARRSVEDFTGASAPMALIDVDEASPRKGEAVPLVVRYFPTRAGEGPRVDHALSAQPARPLRPRTTYLFAVTSRLNDVGGAAVGASESMAAMLDGQEGGEYGARVRAAMPLLTKATGVEPGQVALATLFTTGSIVDETFAMGKALRAGPAPAPEGDLEVVQQGQGEDRRARFKGRFPSPEFRRAKPDGRFEIKGGAPVEQKKESLEFLLSFSDATAVGPRPVVIYGHGLGGDKEGVWGTSERLSEVGVAVIGIDAPEHGSRGASGGSEFQSVLDFFALDDKTGSFDLNRTRDNFRQMAADQLTLVRLIQQLGALDVLPVGAPDGVPDLDPSRILYIGHSFGSVLASTALALAPEVGAGCLNVGGDGLMTIMRESATFQLLVKGLKPDNFTTGDMARFFAASQAVVDPGDPLNFARFVSLEAGPGVEGWRPRSVLLQEVHKDKIVPNLSTELLARALGLAQGGPAVRVIGAAPLLEAPVQGNLAQNTTGVYFQFDRADGKPAEHGELIFTAEARAQYVRFFQGAAAGEAPEVINPYAP